MRMLRLAMIASVVPTFLTLELPALADTACPPGAQCITVDQFGKATGTGKFTAQCSGKYPDFISVVPQSYPGPRFRLSQDYPGSPVSETPPWLQVDFHDSKQAEKYAMTVLNYAYDGMLEANWRAENNTKRKWFHVPWMTAGRHPREFVYGMTSERPVTGPELGLKPGTSINNYAVGYYNAVAGYSIGRVWAGAVPDTSQARFQDGAAVVKILFTDASAADFSGPDILDGAPSLPVYSTDRTGGNSVKPLRLLQIDVAVRDQRAGTSQWVFGTLAYDRTIVANDPWRKMRVVGVMWGNDPNLTPATYASGVRAHEGLINTVAPAYALAHLGWDERLNGPVDNPVSACLSCHGTAQFPALAPMAPLTQCTDEQKRAWFRDLSSTDTFGAIDVATCSSSSAQGESVGLDFSLQTAVALSNVADKRSMNPCALIVAEKNPAKRFMQLRKKTARHVYPVER